LDFNFAFLTNFSRAYFQLKIFWVA